MDLQNCHAKTAGDTICKENQITTCASEDETFSLNTQKDHTPTKQKRETIFLLQIHWSTESRPVLLLVRGSPVRQDGVPLADMSSSPDE